MMTDDELYREALRHAYSDQELREWAETLSKDDQLRLAVMIQTRIVSPLAAFGEELHDLLASVWAVLEHYILRILDRLDEAVKP